MQLVNINDNNVGTPNGIERSHMNGLMKIRPFTAECASAAAYTIDAADILQPTRMKLLPPVIMENRNHTFVIFILEFLILPR